jgi:hypothetical protein
MATHEPGYRPMLVWAHTKIELQELRQKLSLERECQERWLVTAAAELVLAHPELHVEWLEAAFSLEGREAALINRMAGEQTKPPILSRIASCAREIEDALQAEARIGREGLQVAAERVRGIVRGDT